jgi:small subunit ribosomal protein S14
MKNKIFLDKKNRKSYKKQFFKRLREKVLCQNTFFLKKIKIQRPSGTVSRIRNLCLRTGRSRGVARFCQFSRTFLRQYISEGKIMGFSKRSW